MSKARIIADYAGTGATTDLATQAELDTVSTVASDALPKAGGAMTGAITTNSTFDGVDVAACNTTANAALPKAGGTMSGAVTGMTNLIVSSAGTTSPPWIAQLLNTGGGADDNGVLIKGGSTTNEYSLNVANESGTSLLAVKGNGQVGIGVTAPQKHLEIHDTSTKAELMINGGGADGAETARLTFGARSASGGNDLAMIYAIRGGDTQGDLAFATKSASSTISERLRIKANGDIYMGDSMSIGNGVHISTTAFAAARKLSSSSSGSSPISLYWGNQLLYNSSDVRLKENITDTEINGLGKINQLQVKDFTWNDPSDTGYNNRNSRGKWTGLIAQETIDILPFCVNAPRDEETLEPLPNAVDEDEDGETIVPWIMEYGYMVPVLVKAIQELSAKVTALENA